MERLYRKLSRSLARQETGSANFKKAKKKLAKRPQQMADAKHG